MINLFTKKSELVSRDSTSVITGCQNYQGRWCKKTFKNHAWIGKLMFNMLMSCPILMLLKMPVPFYDPSILFTLETFSNLYYVIMEN